MANEIFGENGWSSNVKILEQDFCEEVNGRFNCSCSAIVRITLRDGTYHEDVGCGVTTNMETREKSIMVAKKKAVSDGIKRSIRQFGRALGSNLQQKSFIDSLPKNNL
eukprot:TRINITY_DN367_c0_g1_i2.p1 TRINITY_DN367_c0_g1~~TRINITY_DN367_c0_g1_i2.p1  ORF type:complete len:108 (+),score=15.62 TRINITY_DN367_c0_g1_i2:249-572(+)